MLRLIAENEIAARSEQKQQDTEESAFYEVVLSCEILGVEFAPCRQSNENDTKPTDLLDTLSSPLQRDEGDGVVLSEEPPRSQRDDFEHNMPSPLHVLKSRSADDLHQGDSTVKCISERPIVTEVKDSSVLSTKVGAGDILHSIDGISTSTLPMLERC